MKVYHPVHTSPFYFRNSISWSVQIIAFLVLYSQHVLFLVLYSHNVLFLVLYSQHVLFLVLYSQHVLFLVMYSQHVLFLVLYSQHVLFHQDGIPSSTPIRNKCCYTVQYVLHDFRYRTERPGILTCTKQPPPPTQIPRVLVRSRLRLIWIIFKYSVRTAQWTLPGACRPHKLILLTLGGT